MDLERTDGDERLPLEALDPGAADPGYWHRFREEVVLAAAAELSRRSRAAATVSEVVFGWGRAVVPAALAAALLAGILLFQEPTPGAEEPAPSGIEELLAGDLGEQPIPTVLASESGDAVAAGEF